MDATTKTNIMRTGKGQTKRDKKDGKVVVYFSGHDRLSWPDPPQIPHVRVRLGGGGAVAIFRILGDHGTSSATTRLWN